MVDICEDSESDVEASHAVQDSVALEWALLSS